MKINIDSEKKEALLVFSEEEINTLKKNKNTFTFKSNDLMHFKNNLMNIIVQLDKISPKGFSYGHEDITPKEVTKK